MRVFVVIEVNFQSKNRDNTESDVTFLLVT